MYFINRLNRKRRNKPSSSPQISIAPYQPEHHPVFNLMMLDEYDKFFYEGDEKEFNEKIKMFSDSLGPKGSGTGVVALDGGNPIGFAVSITTRRYLVMAVHPNYSGLGIGKILLSLVVEKLHRAGISKIQARTKKTNLRMQSILNTVGEVVRGDSSDDEYLYIVKSGTLSPDVISQYDDVIENMPNPNGV